MAKAEADDDGYSVVFARIPADLARQVDMELDRRRDLTGERPSMSAFVREALRKILKADQ
jgi:Arc/MetJ-type ribon-helix-helix transcriptional regulator